MKKIIRELKKMPGAQECADLRRKELNFRANGMQLLPEDARRKKGLEQAANEHFLGRVDKKVYQKCRELRNKKKKQLLQTRDNIVDHLLANALDMEEGEEFVKLVEQHAKGQGFDERARKERRQELNDTRNQVFVAIPSYLMRVLCVCVTRIRV